MTYGSMEIVVMDSVDIVGILAENVVVVFITATGGTKLKGRMKTL